MAQFWRTAITRKSALTIGLLVATGLLSWPSTSIISIGAAILSDIDSRYGKRAVKRVVAWEELMQEFQNAPVEKKLRQVNSFFNRVTYRSDQSHWGMEDYWATPLELLATNKGDCEDYTIAKYFTLLALGIPDEHLRLTYVNATRIGQAHMVLTYYGDSSTDPLVLDNLEHWIRPASKRKDLEPVYSFNGAGLWMARVQGQSQGSRNGDASQLPQWTQMLSRLPAAIRNASEAAG